MPRSLRSARFRQPRRVAGALAAAVAVLPVPLLAQGTEGETTVTHALSTFGEPKYPADFEALDYVNAEAPQGGEMSLNWQGGFDSMNPYTAQGRAGYLSSLAFESILTSTADEIGTAYCLLCETMEFPEDRAWVIFTLREGVAFSDGTPMTAEDIVFSYEAFRDEGLPSFRAVLPQVIDNAEALDERRVRFEFNPDSPERDRIQTAGGLSVFSQAWFEENDASLDESRLEPAVGSGPYVLDSLDVNRRIVYRRNPDYWANDLNWTVGRHNFETIRVEYYADANAAFEGFRAGNYLFRNENSSKTWAEQYDFPDVRNGVVVLRELDDGTIATSQSYAFNLRREKFQDPRVREAIGQMFNFEWSNQTLFFGLYERIDSFWENTDLAARNAPTEGELEVLRPLVDEGLLDAEILEADAVLAPSSGARQTDRRAVRNASALLDEAGWTVGEDGMRRRDGQTLDVTILEDSPTFDRVHNPFIQNLRAVGVNARLERVDPAQYTNRSRAHDFDIIVDQFPMDYEPGNGLTQYFGCAGVDDVFNSTGLCDPAVERLIDVVRSAETQDELTASVRALDRVLRDIRPWIPQWYKDIHTVAYYDLYRYPDPLPPYALGWLDLWWVDPDRAQDLRDAGEI